MFRLGMDSAFGRLAYICLLIGSFLFSKDAINQFNEGRTGTEAIQVPITLEDTPTITICYDTTETVDCNNNFGEFQKIRYTATINGNKLILIEKGGTNTSIPEVSMPSNDTLASVHGGVQLKRICKGLHKGDTCMQITPTKKFKDIQELAHCDWSDKVVGQEDDVLASGCYFELDLTPALDYSGLPMINNGYKVHVQ